MDLSLIKSKLDSFQSKGQTKDKIDYSKIFWKPKAGKHQIRIVPSKFNTSTPFREVYFHYGYTKGPILALTNWGEADPILEAAQKLRKSDNPDHWQMAKKITPKMRVFAPVVVRGEEDKGVRLWEFGKEIYTQLMNIAMNEDYGDFTDIQDGRDFVIEDVAPEPADPPPETIYTCSPWQIRKALNNQSLRATVENYVENSTGYDIKDGWKYATEFISNDPFLIAAGQAIGMTPVQIKELVQYASTI